MARQEHAVGAVERDDVGGGEVGVEDIGADYAGLVLQPEADDGVGGLGGDLRVDLDADDLGVRPDIGNQAVTQLGLDTSVERCLASMETVLASTLEYTRQRKAFGQSLLEFQNKKVAG